MLEPIRVCLLPREVNSLQTTEHDGLLYASVKKLHVVAVVRVGELLDWVQSSSTMKDGIFE